MSFSLSLLTAEWLQTPTHAAKLLHERVHRFVLASRRRPCNAQTPQDRGVAAVAVALDDLHAQRRTRVQNVSSLIRRKREEDVLRLHGFAHKAGKELLRQLRLRNTRDNTDGT